MKKTKIYNWCKKKKIEALDAAAALHFKDDIEHEQKDITDARIIILEKENSDLKQTLSEKE